MSRINNSNNDLILISGGGPAGFGAALAFSNNNYKNIAILESRPDMNFDEENSYPVGINVRGRNAIQNLLKNQQELDWNNFGLKVDQWKIIVGPGINVANFDSGLVYGTSRASVTQLLYQNIIENKSDSIQILFGHKTKSVDLKSKTVTCESVNTGEIKLFKPLCFVVADGFRSKARDSLAQSDPTLKVQNWNWDSSFRVLASSNDVTTTLDPAIHYIENRIYISKFLNGKWTAVLSIQENSPQFLRSDNASDENINDLMKYVKKYSHQAANLFSRDEFAKYFSRSIFSGAVVKVNKLVIDSWSVLLGDAAHSVIPATGEGINSALEDCYVLQSCLEKSSNKQINDCLNNYEQMRLEDVNALSDMAYSAARPVFKSTFQMLALSFFKKLKCTGPSKEDLLFGVNSSVILKYSQILKHWKEQTKYLGGPNIPI